MKHKIEVNSLEELPKAAKELLNFCPNQQHFVLFGQMGTGKTTLIKEFCTILGTTDTISSPTYSIVNEYHTDKKKIYHFDLYRLKSVEELLDIGFEEYLYEDAYLFIEWPEKALDFLGQTVEIRLSLQENGQRLIEIEFEHQEIIDD